MKIFLFADLHLDPLTEENTAPALDALVAAAEREQPDLIVNAGDLSMRRGHLAPWVGLRLRQAHVAFSRIAPTIVVAGNHDMSTAGHGVGTVLGALGESAARAEGFGLQLFEEPGLWNEDLFVACLPYPHRDWLLTARPDLKPAEVLPEMSRLLLETLNGLAAQVPVGQRAILVYHGSIAGARTDSEQTMTSDLDVVLNEADIPACFEAALCGHIHRHQQIGRAVYAGSPAPLTFAEERGAHGYVMLDDDPGSGRLWNFRHVALPVAHPLVTVDLRGEGMIAAQVAGPINRQDDFCGAHVRVKVLADPCMSEATQRERWVEFYQEAGASEVRVMIERPEEVRLAGPEVRADASMGGLLALYCERHPEAGPMLDELVAHAASVEALLPAGAVMRAAAAGYRLLSLRWDNWKSYGEGNEIRFKDLGRLVAIEGENATGKSNAAEVEAFALYGRFVRGRQALAEAVRIGAQEAMLAAEFEASGERWKVERRIRLNSKGIGAQTILLARWATSPEKPEPDAIWNCIATKPEAITHNLPGMWLPANLGTARETRELIDELVGPFDLYCKTRFASQGEIDALLDLTPAELKDVLQQALAAQLFEEREKLARPVTLEAEKAFEQHDASLGAWREEAEATEGRRVTWEKAGEELLAARAELAAAEQGLRRAEHDDRLARAELSAIAERELEYQRAEQAVSRARARVAELEAEQEHLAGILRGAAAAEERLAALPEMAERLRVLRDAGVLCEARRRAASAAHELWEDRAGAIDRRREDRERAAQEVMRALSRLEDSRALDASREARAWDAARAAGDQMVAHAIDALKEAERRAGLAERAPFGRKCVEVACPLLADAIAARGQFAERTQAIEHARAAGRAGVEAAERESAERRERFDVERARYSQALETARSADPELPALLGALEEARAAEQAAQASLAAIQIDELGLRRLEREVAELEALRPEVERGRDARATLGPATRESERAMEEFARLRDALSMMVLPDGAVAAENAARAAASLALVQESREAILRATEAAIEAAAQAKARLERAEECGQKLAHAAADGMRLQRAARVADIYLAAVGRDGLPYLMLERALPALADHANHFLCDDAGSGLRIEIGAARELQSGEQRSEVLIRYANDFGTHSLAAASGFERTAIGYALRAALAQIQSEAQGVTLSHWIADEGWGVFDEQNIVRVGQPMLRRLAERFGRVIVISHQAPIREVCDTRLTVIADPQRGSRIERAA